MKSRLEASEAALRSSGSKLRLRDIPGRGRSLVAASAVKAGTTLLTESPVAHVQMPGNADAGCVVCAHCSVTAAPRKRAYVSA